jgi:hypothetical protein
VFLGRNPKTTVIFDKDNIQVPSDQSLNFVLVSSDENVTYDCDAFSINMIEEY